MDLTDFLSGTLGLTEIPKHLLTIVRSFAGFTFVHFVLAPWLCNRWFSTTYGVQSRQTKIKWAEHVVSQVHALIIVPLAFYVIWTEGPGWEDKAYGWSGTTGLVHGIATGYFLWDFLDSILNFGGFAFVLHGFVGLLTCVMSFKPCLAYFVTRALVWEISTLFLNNNWFLDKTNRTGTKLQLFNGILLILSFLGVRLLYGGSICIQMLSVVSEIWGGIPIFHTIMYAGGALALVGLNTVWFVKLIRALRKRFRSEPDKHPKLNGSATGNGVGR